MVDINQLLLGMNAGAPLNPMQMEAIRRRLAGMASGPISAAPIPTAPVGGFRPSIIPIVPLPDEEFTPSIPQPQAPREKSVFENLGDRLNSGLNSPLGSFALNLAANSGPSLAPQSTLSNIGRAGLQTVASQQELTDNALARRLIEARIGLAGAQGRAAETRASAAGATNSNVQSTFQGQNGNMFVVTRDGQVKDTGVAFNEQLRVVTRPDGSVVLIDDTRQDNPVQGTTPEGEQTSGGIVSEVVTPEEAITGAANVRRAETEAAGDPDRERATPLQLESTRNKISQIEQSIRDLQSGELDTGPFQGRFVGLTAAGQRFQRVSGQAVIEAIGQATFGQLSEGEREFLAGTVANPLSDESVNEDALNEMLRILRKSQQIQERDVREAAERRGQELQDFEARGFSIQ